MLWPSVDLLLRVAAQSGVLLAGLALVIPNAQSCIADFYSSSSRYSTIGTPAQLASPLSSIEVLQDTVSVAKFQALSPFAIIIRSHSLSFMLPITDSI